jgi:hypothetical protein
MGTILRRDTAPTMPHMGVLLPVCQQWRDGRQEDAEFQIDFWQNLKLHFT